MGSGVARFQRHGSVCHHGALDTSPKHIEKQIFLARRAFAAPPRKYPKMNFRPDVTGHNPREGTFLKACEAAWCDSCWSASCTRCAVARRAKIPNLRDAEVTVQTGVPGAVNPHKFSIG